MQGILYHIAIDKLAKSQLVVSQFDCQEKLLAAFVRAWQFTESLEVSDRGF